MEQVLFFCPESPPPPPRRLCFFRLRLLISPHDHNSPSVRTVVLSPLTDHAVVACVIPIPSTLPSAYQLCITLSELCALEGQHYRIVFGRLYFARDSKKGTA